MQQINFLYFKIQKRIKTKDSLALYLFIFRWKSLKQVPNNTRNENKNIFNNRKQYFNNCSQTRA